MRGERWPLWALFIAALYTLTTWVGWHRTLIPDEIRPLLLAAGPLQAEMEFARLDMVQTPLSYLVPRGFLELFGHTDATAKALVFVTNVTALVLFVVLARQVTVHWRLATLFCLATYLRIGSSLNQARMYGLLVLLVIAAMILWDRWRVRGHAGSLAGWLVVMTAAAYTHGSALLLLPAFVIANWINGSRRWLFTAAAALPVLALLPWLAFVRGEFQQRGFGANMRVLRMDPMRAIGHLPFHFLTGEDPGGGSPLFRFYSADVPGWLEWTAVSLFLALAVMGWRSARSHWSQCLADDRFRVWLPTLIAFCTLPVALLLAFSVVVVPAVHARYLLVILPAYWLLLTLLWQYGDRPTRVLVGGVLVWIVASAGLAFSLHRPLSAARQAADAVSVASRPGDLILCDRHMPLGWQFYWEWTRRLGRPGDGVAILNSPMAYWLNTIVPGTDLDSLVFNQTPRVWYVHAADRERDLMVRNALQTHGFAVEVLPGAQVPSLVLFRRTINPLRDK